MVNYAENSTLLLKSSFIFFTVTVKLTTSVNGRSEMKSVDENWRSAGKKRRQKSSAGYAREKRRKKKKRKETRIRVKKGVTVTTAVAQTKV